MLSFGLANTIKLEKKMQERALHFIYEDYNNIYEELLHIAKKVPIRKHWNSHYGIRMF